MGQAFYKEVLSFESFDEITSHQRESATKQINTKLRHGISYKEMLDFMKLGLIKQFSFDGEGWAGIKRHIRYCESNGWNFNVDIDVFLKSADLNQIIRITRFT